MSDLTVGVQKPDLTGVAPTYQVCTASDFFVAQPNSMYILHYKNGATAQTTGPNKVVDQVTPQPVGASLVGGWADAVHSSGTGLGANSERVLVIPNTSRFRDGQGKVQLVHPGTLTTVTVNILGPFPASA